jgi:hypothetical protein
MHPINYPEKENTTSTYSASQKLALYYKEKADSDPSWRPLCPDCCKSGVPGIAMIKTATAGFYCVRCKLEVTCYMHKVNNAATTSEENK